MATNELETVASPLVAAASRDRHSALIAAIGEIRSSFAKSGMFPSSALVNEICTAGAQALRDMARSTWEAILRAHKAQGSSPRADLRAVFRRLFEGERANIDAVQAESTRPAIETLQNASLQQTGLVAELYGQLLAQYDAEANVYLGNLKHGPGTSQYEILKHQFLNNRLFAAAAIIVSAPSAFGLVELLIRLPHLLEGVLG